MITWERTNSLVMKGSEEMDNKEQMDNRELIESKELMNRRKRGPMRIPCTD